MALLTLDGFRQVLAGDDAEARSAFLAAFPRRIDPIARAALTVHAAIDRFGRTVHETDRSRDVALFLHAGLNNVVSSTHLLVIGYPLASFHLMRQFGESCAMAMLCADARSGVHEALSAQPERYAVHKSLDRILRKDVSERLRALLGLDAANWQQFKRLTEFYGKFSHATMLAMNLHVVDVPTGQRVIIGSQYDPGKRREFSIELLRRRSALRSLATLCRQLTQALPQRPHPLKRAT